jgi:DNA topoisomerase-1
MKAKQGMRPASDAERKELGIPPAYTEPLIAVDPTADLIAMATITKPDGTTKPFYKYSAKHIARQAAKKFKRVAKLGDRIEKIEARIEKDCRSGVNRDVAMCARLVLMTGLRAGNAPQGEGESFGASSLLLEHCTTEGDTIRLQFIGKKGVAQDVTFRDGLIAGYIRERAAAKQSDLFPHEASATLRYLKSINCEKTHDLRTWRAMMLAEALIEELVKDGPPATKKAAKLLRKTVGIEVAKILGNSPSQALKSYIDSKIIPESE